MNDETLNEIISDIKKEDEVIEKLSKKGKKEPFKKASEIELFSKNVPYQGVSQSMINRIKSIIGNNLIVECPNCGTRQRTQTTLNKKCVGCNKSFAIYPKRGMSRVYHCPPDLIPYLHQLYSLEHYGKFINIL